MGSAKSEVAITFSNLVPAAVSVKLFNAEVGSDMPRVFRVTLVTLDTSLTVIFSVSVLPLS